MSLSSHLNSNDSPVRAWLADHLPNTRAVALKANRGVRLDARRAQPKPVRSHGRIITLPRADRITANDCPVPRLEGADGALVGTAVDYLLRVGLSADAVAVTVAGRGATLLDRLPQIAGRADELEREASDRVCALEPWRRTVDKQNWPELCRCCLVLARLEQWFRAGSAVAAYAVVPFQETTGGLDALAAHMFTDTTMHDLHQLGRAVLEDHAVLRSCKPLVLNPTFAQSHALAGADADLIAEGMLLELKASVDPGVVGRSELWQLVGYALADTEDRYGISSVGVSALR